MRSRFHLGCYCLCDTRQTLLALKLHRYIPQHLSWNDCNLLDCSWHWISGLQPCKTQKNRTEHEDVSALRVMIYIWCSTRECFTDVSSCSRCRGRWNHPAGTGRGGCRGFQLQCQQWQSHSARRLQNHHRDKEPTMILQLQSHQWSCDYRRLNNWTHLDQFSGPPMALLQSYELWGSPGTCTSSWGRGERCRRCGQSQVSAGWCEIRLSCLWSGCHYDFGSGGLVLSSGCQTLRRSTCSCLLFDVNIKANQPANHEVAPEGNISLINVFNEETLSSRVHQNTWLKLTRAPTVFLVRSVFSQNTALPSRSLHTLHNIYAHIFYVEFLFSVSAFDPKFCWDVRIQNKMVGFTCEKTLLGKKNKPSWIFLESDAALPVTTDVDGTSQVNVMMVPSWLGNKLKSEITGPGKRWRDGGGGRLGLGLGGGEPRLESFVQRESATSGITWLPFWEFIVLFYSEKAGKTEN